MVSGRAKDYCFDRETRADDTVAASREEKVRSKVIEQSRLHTHLYLWSRETCAVRVVCKNV